MASKHIAYFIIPVLFFLILPFYGSPQIYTGEDMHICYGEQVTLNAVVELPSNYINIYFDSEDTVHNQVLDIGFSFRFFEHFYDKFVIAPNGWISFDTSLIGTYDDWHITSIPSTEPWVPKKAIMGPWQDWDPVINDSSFVGYALLGNAPLRRLVINWFNVPLTPYYYTKGTFQLILYESSNIIENHITVKPYTFWQDNRATIGVHDSLGLRAKWPDGRNGVSWTTENEAWKFSRTGNYDQPYIVTSTEYDPEIIGVLGDVEWYEETVEPANFLTKGNTLMVAPNQTTRYIARVILNVTLPFYDTVTVFVTPNPEIYAGDDTTIMQGTAATLHGLVTNGNGNYFYHWEPVDMVLDPDQRVTQTVDLMFPQVYQLQVTDNQGCESQIDEMVVAIEFGPLFASMTVDHEVVCAGEIVELEVRAFGGDISQPYSYDWWSDPPGFIITDGDPIQYAQPAETTMYFVRVTDANDSTFVDSTLVTVPEIVPVISGQDTICENEQGVVYQTPATGNFFDWSVIGLIPDKIVESGNTVTIDWGKTSGSGYVKVVETTSDIYHCSDSTQFPVTIFAKPEPPVIAGAISICEGTSEFYSISGPSEDTYEWTLLNPECGRFTGDSSGMSVNIDWYHSGNAILYVKQTTPVGCFSGSDLAVSVNPLPSPGILGWASVCEQDTADYYTPLTSGNQYQWDFFPSSAGEIIGTTDDSRLTVFWKQPGKAYLSVRETVGVTSCTTLSDTFEIEVHPKPVITAFPQIIEVCDGDSDTLNLSGADVYYWSPFDQLSWLNDSTWIMKPVISTTYHITGIDTLTGCQDTTSYHSIFKPNPIIDLGPDQYIQPGQTIVLTPGEGFDEYFWNTGATGSDLSITAAGRYEVTVFMNGCIGNDSVWITMPVHYIPVPNAFTPNGDGRNDKFQLVGPMEEITRFKMQIFNRWGYLLFETSDPFDGWDGTYQGEVCDPGSYLWLITFEERSDGNPVSKQGYVNLLK